VVSQAIKQDYNSNLDIEIWLLWRSAQSQKGVWCCCMVIYPHSKFWEDDVSISPEHCDPNCHCCPSQHHQEYCFKVAAFHIFAERSELHQQSSMVQRYENLQAAVSVRLAGYPQAATKNTHHAAATLPAALAAVLQQEPQLVSGAVEAFYYRDPGDVRAARKLRHFPPDKVYPSALCPIQRCTQ